MCLWWTQIKSSALKLISLTSLLLRLIFFRLLFTARQGFQIIQFSKGWKNQASVKECMLTRKAKKKEQRKNWFLLSTHANLCIKKVNRRVKCAKLRVSIWFMNFLFHASWISHLLIFSAVTSGRVLATPKIFPSNFFFFFFIIIHPHRRGTVRNEWKKSECKGKKEGKKEKKTSFAWPNSFNDLLC